MTERLMTAEEFERRYAERSGVTVAWLRSEGRVVLPCDCDYEDCEKWQSISQENVKDELRLRQPWKWRAGFVCQACWGWIEPTAPHVRQIKRGDIGPGDALYDGAILARMGVWHEYDAPAGIVALLSPKIGVTE